MSVLNTNAVVTGKNIISFAPGISLEDREDIIDVMMYADFFSSQSYRQKTQWTSWMQYYRKQLEYSGCQLRSLLVKEPMVINSAGELDQISFGVKGSVRINNLMDLARRSFKAARLNEYARHFFEYGSDSGSISAFQVVPCERIETGDVSILICGLHASATVTSESVGGDWRVNREMVVRLAGGVYSFNGQAFAAHRERIRTRLRAVARFNIQQVSI